MDLAKRGVKDFVKLWGAEIFSEFHLYLILWEPIKVSQRHLEFIASME
jgi:hypothetical protein